MRATFRWSGILGSFGGLIWAVLFLLEATKAGFDLRNQLLNQPAVGIALVVGVTLQAVGFYGLSVVSQDFSVGRISALICAAGALAQSAALFAVSVIGFGVAWLLGILGELVITFALAAFAISSLSTKLPPTLKVIPFVMIPFYFVGWAIYPESGSAAGLDFVNLSAAFYGLLWIPLGFTIWNSLRSRVATDQSGTSAT